MTARLLISAEGQTEETFIRDYLALLLLERDVFPQPVVVATKRMASGHKFRGGVSGWKQIDGELKRLLRDSGAIAITTMYDLYGLPEDTPGYSASIGQRPSARIATIEQAISSTYDDERFMPYIQMHEFEALVFAAPALATARAGDGSVGAALEAAANEAGGPELVNDGVSTAPSKRLKKIWPGYVKTLDGPAIVGEAGLSCVRAACPHFDGWVGWMENLRTERVAHPKR